MRATTWTHWALGLLSLAALAAGPVTPAAASDAGKKVFLDHKCNKCHSVAAAKIKPIKKQKAGDLSGVGAKHDRKWLGKYLQKQEKLDGKKHKVKFKGEPAEEKALLDFLAGLKDAKK